MPTRRLACRLINGDGIGFEYAIVELTPDYVAQLLLFVDEAEKLTKTHETFCRIEFMYHDAEIGSSLGGLETDLPEFGDCRKWIEIPDGFEWPKDTQQSIASLTVVVTKDTIVWRAIGSHDYCGPCYETDEMTVEKLRQLFPQQKEQEEHAMEEPKSETHRYILYDHDTGDLATTTVYDDYEEAVEDASQLDDVIVLALTFEQDTLCECQKPDTRLAKRPEESHEEPESGKCVLCLPVEYDRDATDPEALACAFDHLLETAMSTPGIIDEYANPTIGLIFLGPDNKSTVCECQEPGYFHSGVQGILARVENGRLAEGSKVERCDSCRRYPSDKAAFDKLVELGMENVPAPQTAKQYIQQGGGFCPNCRSDQIEGNSIDFDGVHCTQNMRCLECHTDWLDVYTLSSIQIQD